MLGKHGRRGGRLTNEDRIDGAARELVGKLKGAAVEMTGDRKTDVEGKATELKGSAQNLYGLAKDTLGDAADQAKAFADDTLTQARERYPEAERMYRRGNATPRPHAKESPLGLVILAGAVGYLLALAIHGRW